MKFSKSDAKIVFELGRWNHNPSLRTSIKRVTYIQD
jgi:hypothetical protein